MQRTGYSVSNEALQQQTTGVLELQAGTNIAISGLWPSQVISATGQAISAPVTVTANYTVGATDLWVISNTSSICTMTLPAASSFSGRNLHFQNYQAFTVISASANVVQIAGGAASTAILNAIAGDTCTLVSNGTNWVMTQYTPNNILLTE